MVSLKTLVKTLKEDGLGTFCGLLTEILFQRGKNIGAAKTLKLIFPASAYIPEIAPSKLSNKTNGNAILVDNTMHRRAQQAAAVAFFYGPVNGRFDTALTAKECHETLMGTIKVEVWCCFENLVQFGYDRKL